MKGSNIPIIKNKRHPRPLSNINGKTKQFRNNQVCRATLCKTDQTRIARLFCRLSCKERREDVIAPIKAKLQNGTYEVSNESFADKLFAKYEEMR